VRIPVVRFTVRLMVAAVIFAAALLWAFDAGRRWERDHGRRGALKVQTVRHVGSWQLSNSAISGGSSSTNAHPLE
jgi:hypothetical protein